MPLLFFIAGYVAILGLEEKGSRTFLLGKAKRVMLPWLISMFTLVPVINIINYYSRLSTGLIKPGSPMPGVDFYLSGMNGTMHHLWFLPLLFYFCIALLAIRRLPATLSGLPFGLVCILTGVLSALFQFSVEVLQHAPARWLSNPLIMVQTDLWCWEGRLFFERRNRPAQPRKLVIVGNRCLDNLTIISTVYI